MEDLGADNSNPGGAAWTKRARSSGNWPDLNECNHETLKEKTVEITLGVKDLEALVTAEIIEVKGTSGVSASPKVAALAPQVIQVHAMSGIVYDVKCTDGENITLIPV